MLTGAYTMFPGRASVYIDLNVGAGMVAWPLSGPLYIPIITLACITPTTRKVDWLIWTVRPMGSAAPKRSLASSSPRNTTRRFSARSASSMKRPPALGIRLRMGPKEGSTPRTRALTDLAPRLTGTRREYSRLMAASSGIRAFSRSMSSSVNWIGRPEFRPAQARVVAPGHSTPMPSPMPRTVRWKARFMPSPNESSITIDSVPQAMASTVRAMRLRLWAASARKSRHTIATSARETSVLTRASGPPRGRASTPGGRGTSPRPSR